MIDSCSLINVPMTTQYQNQPHLAVRHPHSRNAVMSTMHWRSCLPRTGWLVREHLLATIDQPHLAVRHSHSRNAVMSPLHWRSSLPRTGQQVRGVCICGRRSEENVCMNFDPFMYLVTHTSWYGEAANKLLCDIHFPCRIASDQLSIHWRHESC